MEGKVYAQVYSLIRVDRAGQLLQGPKSVIILKKTPDGFR